MGVQSSEFINLVWDGDSYSNSVSFCNNFSTTALGTVYSYGATYTAEGLAP